MSERYVVLEELIIEDFQLELNKYADVGYRICSSYVYSPTSGYHNIIMELKSREEKADGLLRRASDLLADVPTTSDPSFWEDYYLYTGDYMILTDEGWEPGSAKQSYIDDGNEDAILLEVNAPTVRARRLL